MIHIAASVTTGGKLNLKDYKDYFMIPALRGTLGMLESASKAGTVRRVVITSSVIAIVRFEIFAVRGGGFQVFDSEGRVVFDEEPYSSELQAYAASKVAAYNGALDWMERERPSFDVVHLCPSTVLGRDYMRTSARGMIKGTNTVLLSLALGERWSGPKYGTTMHNEDVAQLHIQARSPDIPAGTYAFNWQRDDGDGDGLDWSAVPGLMERMFPEAVKAGKIKPQATQGSSLHTKISGRKTEKVFKHTFLGIEEQITSVVGQYLELLELDNQD